MGEYKLCGSIIPAKLRCVPMILQMLKYVIAVTYVKYSAAATASRFCLIFSGAYKPVKNFAF